MDDPEFDLILLLLGLAAGCPDVVKAERHDPITEGPPQCSERCLDLVLLGHPDLVTPGEVVHKGELSVAHSVVDQDVNVRKSIIRARCIGSRPILIFKVRGSYSVPTLISSVGSTEPFLEVYGSGLSETFFEWVRIDVSKIWIRVEPGNLEE
ncbi:hypothetical protein CRG98_048232 [Punica granatum]|uniref:Uncharacterized protein n=1 Tax=Punica granatum TaxID=22663 RepID=A0A2I0HJ70_PUNGR|nr:hypothetical protein CRG98_048232 [Punica granatum]